MENEGFESGSLPPWVKGGGLSEITSINPADGNYCAHIAVLPDPLTEGSIKQNASELDEIWLIKARTAGVDYIRRNWDSLWGVKLTEGNGGGDILDSVISPETKMSEGWIKYAIRPLWCHGEGEFKIYTPDGDLNVDTIDYTSWRMYNQISWYGQLPMHPNQAITIEKCQNNNWDEIVSCNSDANGSYSSVWSCGSYTIVPDDYRIKADGVIILGPTTLSWLDFIFEQAVSNYLMVNRRWDYRTREGVRFAGNVEEPGTVKIYKQNGGFWDEIGEGTADGDGNYILPASGHCELWNQWTKEGIYRIYLNDEKVGTELFNIGDFSLDECDIAFCKFSIPSFNGTIPSGDEGGIAIFGNVGIEGETVRVTKDDLGRWWWVGVTIADVNGDYRVPPDDWAGLTPEEVKADNYRLYVNDILFEEKFISDAEWDEQP